MASQIDATVPVAGTPTTESVRNNFLTARNEISNLQDRTEGSPFLRLVGGRMMGPMYLFNDPTDAMMPATKGYVDAGGGGGGGGGIPEAPATGQIFGRGDGAWQQVVRVAGETMSGPLILADDPDDPLGAVPKRMLDALADIVIPEPPDDSDTVFGRGDGEWLPVLSLTGGQLSGSIGTIAIPTSPAPFNVNIFSNAFNAVSGVRLNAYQSAANTYNYLVPAATMPGAALLHLSGTGNVALRVAPGGAAGDPITPGPAVTFDYKGNLMLGSAPVIPTDGSIPTLSTLQHVVGLSGHLSFNSYLTPGLWKYLQGGYAAVFFQSTIGDINLQTANMGATGGPITFNPAFTFTVGGHFSAPGNVYCTDVGAAGNISCINFGTVGTVVAGGDITTNGQVVIGGAASGFLLAVQPGIAVVTQYNPQWFDLWNMSSGTRQWAAPWGAIMTLEGDGNLHIVGTLNQGSDQSLKTNTTPLTSGLGVVRQLIPKSYQRAGVASGQPNPTQWGFIAQDVEPVIPHAVTASELGAGDGALLSLDPHQILAAVTLAMKQMDSRCTRLEAVANISPPAEDLA